MAARDSAIKRASRSEIGHSRFKFTGVVTYFQSWQ